jgi:hypothetical protein
MCTIWHPAGVRLSVSISGGRRSAATPGYILAPHSGCILTAMVGAGNHTIVLNVHIVHGSRRLTSRTVNQMQNVAKREEDGHRRLDAVRT